MCLRGCMHPAAFFRGARQCAPFLWAALLAVTQAGAQTGWNEEAIRGSRQEIAACARRADAAPLTTTDLILALRDSGQELLLLDTATLETRASCRLPQPLQGTPLRSGDGRTLYLPAASGWVLRIDLEQLQPLVALRTGHALRGLALSGDDRWLLAGHAAPHQLVLLDASLQLVRRYPATALAGDPGSAVTAVWHAGPRRSFVVAFETLPELWELSYDLAAEPIFDGLVHDYRMGEAVATRGYLGVRRTPLEQPQGPVLADATARQLLTVTPPSTASNTTELAVINLDIRRRIRAQTLDTRPLPWAGTAYTDGAQGWLLLPTAAPGRPLWIDTKRWQLHVPAVDWTGIRDVRTARSQTQTPQLWLHATTTAGEDTLLLLDKQSLQRTATLPAASQVWNEVSFAGEGRLAVLATQGPRGELRVLDTTTLRELRRRELNQIEAVYALDAPRAAPAAH